MKRILICATLSIIFSFLFFYLIRDVINPLQSGKVDELVALYGFKDPKDIYLEIDNLIERGIVLQYISLNRLVIVGIVGLLAFSFFFATIHLILDKLFFKEFYRPPNLLLALRRGTILALAIIAMYLLRFIGMPMWQAGLGSLLIIIVEILITSISNSRKHQLDFFQQEKIEETQVAMEVSEQDQLEENDQI